KVHYENHKIPNGNIYGYRASKSALNMINSCMAMDLKSDNVIAIVLQPGYVNTELTYGKGVVQPEDSVAGMTKVIASVTPEDTAKFFDFQGPELPCTQAPANVMSAANKTVLITGANRGIGLIFAEHYTKAGWKLIGTARDVQKTEKLQALSPFKIVQLDTCDEDSIKHMAEELNGIPIDLLVNNAGILEEGEFDTVTKESFMRQFETNSVGTFLVTRALRPSLKLAASANGTATVASVSTILASVTTNIDGAFAPIKKVHYENFQLPNGHMYGYRASKSALNMINSCMAMDLKSDNIIAIVLQPGYVNTELTYGKGVVQPEDSVAGMTKVIASVTPEDTAKFFDFQGPELPW
ncbi:hypothetical protein BBJ28_00026748, partial [Nothophytophthora sp. Chile5]